MRSLLLAPAWHGKCMVSMAILGPTHMTTKTARGLVLEDVLSVQRGSSAGGAVFTPSGVVLLVVRDLNFRGGGCPGIRVPSSCGVVRPSLSPCSQHRTNKQTRRGHVYCLVLLVLVDVCINGGGIYACQYLADIKINPNPPPRTAFVLFYRAGGGIGTCWGRRTSTSARSATKSRSRGRRGRQGGGKGRAARVLLLPLVLQLLVLLVLVLLPWRMTEGWY